MILSKANSLLHVVQSAKQIKNQMKDYQLPQAPTSHLHQSREKVLILCQVLKKDSKEDAMDGKRPSRLILKEEREERKKMWMEGSLCVLSAEKQGCNGWKMTR